MSNTDYTGFEFEISGPVQAYVLLETDIIRLKRAEEIEQTGYSAYHEGEYEAQDEDAEISATVVDMYTFYGSMGFASVTDKLRVFVFDDRLWVLSCDVFAFLGQSSGGSRLNRVPNTSISRLRPAPVVDEDSDEDEDQSDVRVGVLNRAADWYKSLDYTGIRTYLETRTTYPKRGRLLLNVLSKDIAGYYADNIEAIGFFEKTPPKLRVVKTGKERLKENLDALEHQDVDLNAPLPVIEIKPELTQESKEATSKVVEEVAEISEVVRPLPTMVTVDSSLFEKAFDRLNQNLVNLAIVADTLQSIDSSIKDAVLVLKEMRTAEQGILDSMTSQTSLVKEYTKTVMADYGRSYDGDDHDDHDDHDHAETCGGKTCNKSESECCKKTCQNKSNSSWAGTNWGTHKDTSVLIPQFSMADNQETAQESVTGFSQSPILSTSGYFPVSQPLTWEFNKPGIPMVFAKNRSLSDDDLGACCFESDGCLASPDTCCSPTSTLPDSFSEHGRIRYVTESLLMSNGTDDEVNCWREIWEGVAQQ